MTVKKFGNKHKLIGSVVLLLNPTDQFLPSYDNQIHNHKHEI